VVEEGGTRPLDRCREGAAAQKEKRMTSSFVSRRRLTNVPDDQVQSGGLERNARSLPGRNEARIVVGVRSIFRARGGFGHVSGIPHGGLGRRPPW
jgi:hypothetical protein